MNRFYKWLLILGTSLIVMILLVLFLAPMLIDIRKYRPAIENAVFNATGRTLSMGEDFYLSLFPTASIAVNDVQLGNAPGFEKPYIVHMESLEVRMKLVPFVLSRFKDIQVECFFLNGAHIIFEKDKKGNVNWEMVRTSVLEEDAKPQKDVEKSSGSKPEEAFFLKNISVGEFAVTNSSLVWFDHSKNERVEISDLNFRLRDISLDRPVHLTFSAQVDGHALGIDGSVGPFGEGFGKKILPIEVSIRALKQLEVKIKGSIIDAGLKPDFDMTVEVPLFSPRKLSAAAGRDFPISTLDLDALTRVAFKADIKGDLERIEVSEGVAIFDKSKVDFSCVLGDFSLPNVTFDLSLDQIDLDMYLPPGTGNDSNNEEVEFNEEVTKEPNKNNEKVEVNKKESLQAQNKTDYGPLRRLVLNGTIRAGKMKAAKVLMQDLDLKITGKNGVFNLDPFSLNLYHGTLKGNAFLNVEKDIPVCGLNLQTRDINSNPLLKDVLDKDILEGRINADLRLRIKGDDADGIIRSLMGKGGFLINDGVVKGIDLASMIRNTDGAYGFAGNKEKTPSTAFSEFQIPFTIKNGLVKTKGTRIVSTLIRAQTAGSADLVNDVLDFRIEPVFVTSKKTDKDKMKRSEVMIPVLVTGSLSSPIFHADLRGIAEQKLEEKVFESSRFKKIFEKEEMKEYEDDVKNLLKGLLDIPIFRDEEIND